MSCERKDKKTPIRNPKVFKEVSDTTTLPIESVRPGLLGGLGIKIRKAWYKVGEEKNQVE